MKFKFLLFAAGFGAFLMSSCQQGETVVEETTIQEEDSPSEVTDDDLKLFAFVVSGLQQINQSIQEEMMETIVNNGMELEAFGEMQMAMQNPETADQFSDDEQRKFALVISELEKIQVDGEQAMMDLLDENGLSEARYQEIGMSLQTDPEKMNKFQMYQEEFN
jgi:hypothetical protein